MTRTQLVVDVTAAALFFVGAVLLSFVGTAGISLTRVQFVATVALFAVFSAGLAIRRWSPTLALAVAWFGALVQMAFALPPLPANLAIFAILYAAAVYGTRLAYWLSFASSIVGALVITLYLVVPPVLAGGWTLATAASTYAFLAATVFVSAALALLLSWTAGALVRTGVRARENRRAQEIAEAQAAAEAERTRIARDMHDVVAHSLAVVIAQADGARYAAAAEPQAATAALGTISTAARAALSDVRMLLTQLRHTQSEGPQPTLADLETLYAQVRAAGVALEVDVDPAPRAEVPAATQLAVYRILQEALTNALRHGAPGAVAVGLAWHDDRVELSVTNPTADADGDAPSRGHGLIGMRERAQLAGGSLDAAAEGGRFVVRARLPIGEAA